MTRPPHRARTELRGAGRQPAVSYADRWAVLATKHDKLPLVAPPLAAVGVKVTGVADNTDQLGTFTEEVRRPGTPLETAVAKARLGMAATGSALGLASEGSIGPHPASPFLTADIEVVVLVDADRDLVVWAAARQMPGRGRRSPAAGSTCRSRSDPPGRRARPRRRRTIRR